MLCDIKLVVMVIALATSAYNHSLQYFLINSCSSLVGEVVGWWGWFVWFLLWRHCVWLLVTILFLTIFQPLTYVLYDITSWSNGWMDFGFTIILGQLGIGAIILVCTPSAIEVLFSFVDGILGNVLVLLGNTILGSLSALVAEALLALSSGFFCGRVLDCTLPPIIKCIVRN